MWFGMIWRLAGRFWSQVSLKISQRFTFREAAGLAFSELYWLRTWCLICQAIIFDSIFHQLRS
jgi:hypothetical protein